MVIAHVESLTQRDDGYTDVTAVIDHTLFGVLSGAVVFYAPPRASGGLRLGSGAQYLLLLVREDGEVRLAPCGPSQEISSPERLQQLLSYGEATSGSGQSAILPWLVAVGILVLVLTTITAFRRTVPHRQEP